MAGAIPGMPQAPPSIAVPVCGAVVGVVEVGLTVLLMTVFELVRGTSTGGDGWGLLALVVVLAASVALGAFLLGSLRVPQPKATSLVGVLLVLIVVLAFLLDVIFSAWMWLAIPALSAAAYAGAYAVLSRAEG